MNFFGFGGPPAVLSLNLDDEEGRRSTEVDMGGDKMVKCPVYRGEEALSGSIEVFVPAGRKLEHQGVKVEVIGVIEMYYDRSQHEFLVEPNLLVQPGELSGRQNFEFQFERLPKRHESYNGINVRCRYFLRATLMRNTMNGNITAERELCIENQNALPETNPPIEMEVGIEEYLHIEFEYSRHAYHLSDIITGKIFFVLVHINIKHMELALIRRETAGTGSNTYTESETITKFEVMDGAPVRGEVIPIRLFLQPFHLTPTFDNAEGKFSVKYYLNLVLVDDQERRYFKQHEVQLLRTAESDIAAAAAKEELQLHGGAAKKPAVAPAAAAAAAGAGGGAAWSGTATSAASQPPASGQVEEEGAWNGGGGGGDDTL